MVGVGRAEAEHDDAGGLQSLFDIEQAKNVATYVHQGSALFIILYSIYSTRVVP